MRTSELTGAALDWAVAKCEGVDVDVHSADMIIKRRLQSLTQEEADTLPPPKPYLVVPGVGNANYSGSWAQGGPMIERERIFVRPKTTGGWRCWIYDGKGDGIKFDQSGPTPLIAAMRCYVASKLGDEVAIPNELTGVNK